MCVYSFVSNFNTNQVSLYHNNFTFGNFETSILSTVSFKQINALKMNHHNRKRKSLDFQENYVRFQI